MKERDENMTEELTGKTEGKNDTKISLSMILGGDFLLLPMLQRQIKLIVLIIALCIFYISNRYSFQQEQIEINKLQNELIQVKYKAQTRSSEFLRASRQSKLQEDLEKEHSDLKMPAQSPFILNRD